MGMKGFLLATLFLSNIFLASSQTETTPPWTTAPRLPCNNHECEVGDDGYFSEGDCEDTFCQCNGGQGFLHTCEEGTFFDPVMEVCNWPWNIPSCGNILQPDLQKEKFRPVSRFPSKKKKKKKKK